MGAPDRIPCLCGAPTNAVRSPKGQTMATLAPKRIPSGYIPLQRASLTMVGSTSVSTAADTTATGAPTVTTARPHMSLCRSRPRAAAAVTWTTVPARVMPVLAAALHGGDQMAGAE